MNWTKSVAWIVMAVVLVGVVSLGGWAQAGTDTPSSPAPVGQKASTSCPAYVDANGDGVCDNKGTGNCGKNCKNGNGGSCPNYVDADGDGICDKKGTGQCGRSGQGGKCAMTANTDAGTTDNQAQVCAGKRQGGGQGGNGNCGGGNGQCNRKRQGRG